MKMANRHCKLNGKTHCPLHKVPLNCDTCNGEEKSLTLAQKLAIIIMCVLLTAAFLSGCIVSNGKYYNTLEPRNLIILDTRYVPGFTGPDQFLLKVREGNEFRWVKTTREQFDKLHKGDTLKTVLILKPL